VRRESVELSLVDSTSTYPSGGEAQPGERLACNQEEASSILATSTNFRDVELAGRVKR
jgi:hypothetical protein